MDLTSHRQDKGLSPRSSHCRLRKWKDCSNLRFSPTTDSLNTFAIVASVNAWYLFFAHYNAIMSCVQVIFHIICLFMTQGIDRIEVCCFIRWQHSKDNSDQHGKYDRSDCCRNTDRYRHITYFRNDLCQYDPDDHAKNSTQTGQHCGLC